MNVGSLFAGIGGFELGLERAGFEITWQVELDPWCRSVLAERFPGARRLEDVREVGAATLEPVDLICGGFPCQDLSFAGKGAGLDGARSGLWSEFARLVRELRPPLRPRRERPRPPHRERQTVGPRVDRKSSRGPGRGGV